MAIRSHGEQGDDDNRNPPRTPRQGARDQDEADAISDPLLAWAVRTNFRYLGGPPDWIPLLVHAPRRTALEVEGLLQSDFGAQQAAWVIPELFLKPPAALEKSPYFGILLHWKTGRLQKLALQILTRLEALGGYEFGLPIGPATQGTRPKLSPIHANMPPPPAPLPISGPPVLPTVALNPAPKVAVGIIDDAFALAHDRLRTGGTINTRLDSVWVQDLGPVGTLFFAGQIDAQVAACQHAGLVDESQVYRNLGLEDFAVSRHKSINRSVAHGTLVMDIAAGRDPGTGPSDSPIIGVQLPGHVVRDTSGAHLTPWALWGLYYILLRSQSSVAPAHFGDVPVVVNLSYGLFNGPHDGTSHFEQAVDSIVRLWNSAYPKGQLCVVLPTGNNYLWRTHAHFRLKPQEAKRLEWRLVPDGRTPSHVEVWLPHQSIPGPAPSATVQVTAPDGTTSGPMNLGSPDFVMPPQSSALPTVWTVKYQATAVTHSRPRITVDVAPTAAYNPRIPGEAVAPSGLWHIDVTNTGLRAEVFDAWIYRNDTPFGWRVLGRQSYFDDPGYIRFSAAGRYVEVDDPASYVRRLGTINGLATGARTVVVAGCRKSDLVMARYSAAGPVVVHPNWPLPFLQRAGPDPDASAISEDSPTRRGVLAAGTRSNTAAAMGGTSVAAPQITRWIAGQMWNGTPTCRSGVDALADYEERTYPRPPVPPPQRTGKGRIDDQEPPLPYPHESR